MIRINLDVDHNVSQKLFFLHLCFADRDQKGHVTSSLQIRVEHNA